MPTVLDSLIVQLGLDVKDLQEGQKKMSAALQKARDDSKSVADQIEENGKRAAEFFTRLRNEAIALFAAFAGFRSIEELTRHLGQADAAVHRLSSNMGIGARTLNTYENAVEAIGGTAQDANQSIQSLVNSFEEIKFTGTSANAGVLRYLGLSPQDLNNIPRALDKIHTAFMRMRPQEAQYLGTQLGFTPEFTYLLRQQNYRQLLEEAGFGAGTEQDFAEAQKRYTAWVVLQQKFSNMWRRVLTDISPIVEKVLTFFDELYKKNKAWIDQHIDEYIGRFSTWLQSIDWTKVKKDVEDFWNALTVKLPQALRDFRAFFTELYAKIDPLVQKFGGWKNVLTALLALWVVSKFAAPISIITTILGLVTGIAGGLLRIAGISFSPLISVLKGPLLLALQGLMSPLGIIGASLTAMLWVIDQIGTKSQKAAEDYEKKTGVHNRFEPGHEGAAAGPWDFLPGMTATEGPGQQTAPPGAASNPHSPLHEGVAPGAPGTPEAAMTESNPYWRQAVAASTGIIGQATGMAVGAWNWATGRGGKKGEWGKNWDEVVNFLINQGQFSPEKARGIASGLFAESGLNPEAVNPTSGAYGIAQWLGDRKKRLFALYGQHPNLQQQLAFLVWELHGGDPRGTAAVSAAPNTAGGTAAAFIGGFERPGAGYGGDIGRSNAALAAHPPNAYIGQMQQGLAPSTVGAAKAQQTSMNTSTSNNDNSTQTNIGTINVNMPPGTDAQGIAQGIGPAVQRYGFVTKSNYGLA